MVTFPQGSPSKPCTRLSPPPYALHAPPISFFMILSLAQYWVSSTDHYVPHYVLSSAPLLPVTICSQSKLALPHLVCVCVCTGMLRGNFRTRRQGQRDTCAEERGTSSVRSPVARGNTLHSLDVRECPRRRTNAKYRLFVLEVIVGSYSVVQDNCWSYCW